MGGGKGLLMGPHLKSERKHHTHKWLYPKFLTGFWSHDDVNLPGICNHRTTSALAELLRRQHQTSLVMILHKKIVTDLMESSKPIEWVKHSGLTLWMCWIVARLLWGILLRYDTIPCSMYVYGMVFGQEMFGKCVQKCICHHTLRRFSAVISLGKRKSIIAVSTPLQLSIAVSWLPEKGGR